MKKEKAQKGNKKKRSRISRKKKTRRTVQQNPYGLIFTERSEEKESKFWPRKQDGHRRIAARGKKEVKKTGLSWLIGFPSEAMWRR